MPNLVVDDYLARLGAGPTVLLLCLGRHANKDRKCYPSIDHLQEISGLARSTVIKYLNQMENWMIIRREKGERNRTIYTILPPSEWFNSRTSPYFEPVQFSDKASSKHGPSSVQFSDKASSKSGLLPPYKEDSVNKTHTNKTQLTIPPTPQGGIARTTKTGAGCDPKSQKVWEAYREAYAAQYGTDPVRNAKVNANMCQLIDRLGNVNAPKVAAWFLSHRGGWYVKELHSVGCLLRDCEKLHTEWVTGTRLHQRDVQEVDRLSADAAMWKRIDDKLEAKKRETV